MPPIRLGSFSGVPGKGMGKGEKGTRQRDIFIFLFVQQNPDDSISRH